MQKNNKRKNRKPAQDQNPEKCLKHLDLSPVNPNNKRFSWNMKSADLDGKYGWSRVEMGSLFREIIPKLQNYGTMTWEEIEGKESHFVDLDNCSKDAQERLKEIELVSLEQLFSLRIGSRKRIWGWRQKLIFHVLWWDPEHEVCPSRIRRT